MTQLNELWILLILCVNVETYTIRYNDCTKPNKVTEYRTDSNCKNIPAVNQEKKEIQILQEITDEKLKGYSCSIVTSRFTYYCGSFSHIKLAKVPEIEVNEDITPLKCHDLVNSRKFRTRDGMSHPLTMNTEVLIKSVELGEVKDANNAVSCKGQTVNIGGELIDDILIITQTKVVIQEEDFILTGRNIEAVDDHLILECSPSSGGCRSNRKTYIWGKAKSDCPLKLIRQTTMEVVGEYLIDRKEGVVIKKLAAKASPPGCPNGLLFTTEYSHVFITEDVDQRYPVLGEEMSLPVYIKSKDDFLLYYLEEKIQQWGDQMGRNMCENKHTLRSEEGKVVRISTNNFSYQSGEVTYIFNCAIKEDQIASLPKCYTDIPIKSGGFVTPNSRIFKRYSKEMECNKHFPLKVHGVQSWVELTPEPKTIKTPNKMPLTKNEEITHLEVSGGIYTEAEVRAWEMHLEQSGYHNQILHQITQGVCLNEGLCMERDHREDTMGYDLNLLRKPLGKLFWFQELQDKIKAHTGVLCLCVLCIEAFKLIASLTAILLATTREGIAGLTALLWSCLCPLHSNWTRMRRRAERRRRNPDETRMMDEAKTLSNSSC